MDGMSMLCRDLAGMEAAARRVMASGVLDRNLLTEFFSVPVPNRKSRTHKPLAIGGHPIAIERGREWEGWYTDGFRQGITYVGDSRRAVIEEMQAEA